MDWFYVVITVLVLAKPVATVHLDHKYLTYQDCQAALTKEIIPYVIPKPGYTVSFKCDLGQLIRY